MCVPAWVSALFVLIIGYFDNRNLAGNLACHTIDRLLVLFEQYWGLVCKIDIEMITSEVEAEHGF